jgi:hypothetical protein
MELFLHSPYALTVWFLMKHRNDITVVGFETLVEAVMKSCLVGYNAE